MIVFISGLSGTGKSALAEYFQAHPIDGWAAYDFDKGKEKCPDDPAQHLAWRTRQTDYWLGVASENKTRGLSTIIFGLTLYPSQIKDLAKNHNIDPREIRTALIYCEPNERKERIYGRGTPRHWQGHKPWYDEFYAVMRRDGDGEFDTTGKTVGSIANEIISWVNTFSKSV